MKGLNSFWSSSDPDITGELDCKIDIMRVVSGQAARVLKRIDPGNTMVMQLTTASIYLQSQ